MSESEKLKKAVRRILRTHNVDLKEFVQHDLQKIAGGFHAKELITQTKVDEMKVSGVLPFTLAAKLVDACQPSLVTYPEKNFPRFIGVLKKYETTEDLARTMETEFKEAGGKMPGEGRRVKSALAQQGASSSSSTVAYPESVASAPHPSSSSRKRPHQDSQDESQDSTDFGPLEAPAPEHVHEGGSQEPVYPVTTRKSHALAVILNNYTFKPKKFLNLPPSEGDVLRLKKVLEDTLGFKVVTLENLTGTEIKKLFKSHFNGRIEEQHDSFFCCILSHGGKDQIDGTDGKPVNIADLMKFLDGKNCGALSGKPKIMIIDCCRGLRIPKPAVTKHAGSKPSGSEPSGSKASGPGKFTSPRSDFIFGYSTFRDDVAVIGEEGSLYIQKLCEVMEKNDCSLNQMLCTVNRELQEHGTQLVEGHGKKRRRLHEFVQIGQVEHTLRDFVFFQKP